MSNARPNIVLTIADDQRHDMIHALGDPMVQTPNLDRLVAEGTACTHVFHQGSMIQAVCAPSRAMLHSGRDLFHLPHELLPYIPPFMRDVPDPGAGSAVLLGEHLRRHGYRTFVVGKWHNHKETLARSFDGGDAIFFGGMSDHDHVPIQPFDQTGRYPKERTVIGDKFSTDLFVDAAVRIIEELSGDQPFFLYVAFTSPHDPRTPPKRWADQYDPAKVPLPGNFLPEHPFDNGEMGVRDEQLAARPRTREEIRRHIADYYGMVSELDEGLGRIDDALRRRGLADRTIRVHTADHGLSVGQHGLMGKQNLYEHSVRVPMVLRGPGIPRGRRTDALCQLHDLYPTLCDLVGIETPDTCEARSFHAALTGQTERHRDTVVSAYMAVQRMVRDDRYKLIEYTVHGERRSQLFDLREDPLELRDLSDDPALTDRLPALRAELTNWQKRVGDPLLNDAPVAR